MNENEQNIEMVDQNTFATEDAISQDIVAEPTIPETQEVAPPKKKGGKLAILIGAAAAVVLAGAVTVAAVSSTPIGLLSRGIKKSISAAESSALMSFAQDLSNGGSTEIVADLGDLVGKEGSVSAKVYTDADDQKMMIEAGVQFEGQDALDASVYCDENNLSVTSKCLLNEGAYGFGLENFSKRFNKSQFGKDGKFSLGVEMPETTDTLLADQEKFTEDTQQILNSASKVLLKSLKEQAEITKDSATVQLGNGNVNTTAITITMDDKQMVAVLTDMLEYLRNDEEVKAYLKDNAKYYLTTGRATPVEQEDIDEFIEEFYSTLEDAYKDLENVADELDDADAHAEFTFHINKRNRQLIGIEFNIEAYDEPIKISAYAGPNLKKAEEIRVRVNSDGDVYRINYTVTANDKKEFSAELKAYEDDMTVLDVELQWNKETEEFTISGKDSWDTLKLKGTFANSGKSIVIKLEKAEFGSQSQALGITVTLTASDPIPAMPQYTDVLDMNADEAENLIKTISQNLQSIAQKFAG